MQTSLEGQVAIITQAALDNGPAICESLGQQGAKIVLGDVNSARLDSVMNRLAALGIEALAVKTDASQPDQLENLLGQAVKTYERVDIMVNNTRLFQPEPADTLSFNTFVQEVSANVDPVFFGSQTAARHMLAQPARQIEPYPLQGVIINIASVAGVVAISGHAAFCSAMAAVMAMTQTLAAEWGPHGVRVAAVGVGITETMLKEIGVLDQPQANDHVADPAETYMTLQANAPRGYIPVGGPVSPEAVGQAVAYLAGDAAAYVTGTTLFADGGWLSYGYL